ncbi:MAG: hypothetical protein WCG36_05000 [bacterium]
MDLEIVSAMMTPESGADIFTDHPVEIQLIWTKVDLGPGRDRMLQSWMNGVCGGDLNLATGCEGRLAAVLLFMEQSHRLREYSVGKWNCM